MRQADLDERRRDDGLTTDEKEETACDEPLDRILREYIKLCKHGITDEELEPYRDLDESLVRIDGVTLEEVNAACQRFYNPGDQFTLTLGPA